MFRCLIIGLGLWGVVAASPAAGEPGRLVSAETIDPAGGIAAWRIRYETRDHLGRPVESTGLVAAPTVGASERPVVAWAHGTMGVVESCAPSRDSNPLATIPQLQDMVARGWVVVASDYPGLGTSGPHAYLVADAAAPAVLDAVRAARALGAARAGARFAIWGHSQGGHAGLAAAAASARDAPDLQLVGVVAVSPPTDLAANMHAVSPLARGIFGAFVARSWSEVYDVALSTIANRTTRGVIMRTTSSCVGGKVGLAQMLRAVRLRHRLGTFDFSGTPPWSELIARNSITRVEPAVPLMIVSAANDEVVADQVTRRFAADACRQAAHVTFLAMERGDHATTAIETGPRAVQWIGERFAGARQVDDCPL